MRKFTLLCLSSLLSLCAYAMNTREAVKRADVLRTDCPQSPTVYLYQGNGQFGTSYGPLGLHLNPSRKHNSWGKTHYLNLNHRSRGKFNHDYLLPMLEIYWGKDFADVSDYTQHQDYYDGTITTSFATDDNKFTVQTWFDPVDKSIAAISIDAKKGGEEVILAPMKQLNVHYGQNLTQDVAIKGKEIVISCLEKQSSIFLDTNAAIAEEDGQITITLRKGNNYILLSYGKPADISAKKSLARTKDHWHRQWESHGIISVPDKHAQQTWIRSMAMFLSSYDDLKNGLAPPMGFTGNWWPFYYPQDVSYVHPVFLSTGYIDIAKSWIERWAEDVEALRDYTKRFYGVDGILAPWVYPYGSFEGYHNPGPPNRFFYEIHNSGYFARMASETAAYVDDPEWTRKNVLPILEGCAEFYSNIARKGEDGLWHLFVTPSTGQDEHGGSDREDYLCALYSAQYCLQQAVEHGLDKDGRYAAILKDGPAFESLKSPQGFYYSCAGQGEKDFGMQKHPVQLNELAFVPVNASPSDAARKAYALRYDITQNARQPYFYGWTLGEFLLAGSRMGDTEGWKYDWAQMEPAEYVDPEWIQIYETSRNTTTPFYNITNGLVAQSLLNNLVCDWYGELELAKCNPWDGPVEVRDIVSKLGVSVDGTINGTSYDVNLTAWKDTALKVDGNEITLKKGDKIRLRH
ncbi:MAG: hypothetical protein HDS65_07195 [Bacteroidales bacterium]|nr:hypothetical protein [Bacteroidales bacterium]